MPFDGEKMGAQIGHEGVDLRVAEKNRDPTDPRAVRRQRMRLRVVDHLQTVLEAAQKPVIVYQFRRGRAIDAASSRKTPQRLASRPNLQLADPAAPDQLLGMRGAFDRTDTAPARL